MRNTFTLLAAVFFVILLHNTGCAQQKVDSLVVPAAPDSFKVVFTTSKGSFTAVAYRSWSPKGVDRFHHLVATGFYDSVVIFRVVKGFVAQFGLSNSEQLNNYYKGLPISDEPVKASNKKGTISFARSTKDSRTSQLFININDNTFLDNMDYGGTLGFPPIAKITEGYHVVESLFAGYGENPSARQDSIAIKGMSYTTRAFPNLDYIISAKVSKIK
ncbi:MAG: peptidylprolyl isomerase [Ignavibacteriales bacterium]|nr:peptidylprolyl isomerase [Ignavibacteriales bacterium]